MPGKDHTRWKQNEDGTWSRRVEGDKTLYALSQPVEAEEEEVYATQGALDAANEHGIDLATIQGTGKDGKITKADVEAAAKED